MPMEPTEPAQTSALSQSLTNEEIVSDLSRVLTELNKKSPQEIALLLSEKGIKGTPRGAQACPIANYIRQECAWADTVIVAPGFVSAYPYGITYEDVEFPTAIDNRTLENITNFIWSFDTGQYPFLLTRE